MDIESLVIAVIKQYFRKENVSASDTSESLYLDSLDEIELILEIEEKFNIEISDAEAENVKSVSQLVSCVESKLTN